MKMEDCLTKHCACVYCLLFPNGKKYVGKSRDLGDRVMLYIKCSDKHSKVNSAIREFGIDNVDLSILFSMPKCKADDLDVCLSIIEIKYIRELCTIYPNGYNISLGGEVLGIPPEDITTDKDVIKSFYSSNKVVLEYDIDGNFVKEYPSVARFSYEKGVNVNDIGIYLDKRKLFHNNSFLRSKKYGYIPDKIDVVNPQELIRYKVRDVVKKNVIYKEVEIGRPISAIVYDRSGNFVGEYSSKSEVSRVLFGGSSLDWGVYKNGYIAFKKESNDYPKKIESMDEFYGMSLSDTYKPVSDLDYIPKIKDDGFGSLALDVSRHKNLKLSFAINQFTLDGEFVAQFRSIRDASAYTGIRYSQIYACVSGKTRKAAGYIWQKNVCD